jgi:hypothetical protein
MTVGLSKPDGSLSQVLEPANAVAEDDRHEVDVDRVHNFPEVVTIIGFLSGGNRPHPSGYGRLELRRRRVPA